MIQPLTRDYWPERMSRPYLRAVAAFFLAPLLTLCGVSLIIWIASRFIPGGLGESPLVLFLGACVAVYVVTGTLGLAAFLALWSFRVKSWWGFMLAGALVGVLAVIAESLRSDIGFSGVIIGVVAVLMALVFLLIRALAGIRTA